MPVWVPSAASSLLSAYSKIIVKAVSMLPPFKVHAFCLTHNKYLQCLYVKVYILGKWFKLHIHCALTLIYSFNCFVLHRRFAENCFGSTRVAMLVLPPWPSWPQAAPLGPGATTEYWAC